MNEPLSRLRRALVLLLVERVKAENAALRADGYLMDMAYDDCPVCLANRRRDSFTPVPPSP